VDKGMAKGAVALVVDGFSTGEFYPGVVAAKGLSPVHVSSGVERGTPGLEEYIADCLEHLRPQYAQLFSVPAAGGLEALAARLAPLNPCCVLAGCEMGVETAELLAQRLGLPGNDPATSRTRRNKLAMHQALAAAGLPSLRSLATADAEEALTFAEGLGSWPVVVKPLRSAATEGVSFCRDAAELREALAGLLGVRNQFGEANLQVLVQQCAVGREFAVNTVTRAGRHLLTDLWEYRKVPTPGGAPLYDRTMLVRELAPEHRVILDYAFAVLDALGVRVGPAHTEVMLTAGGPVLIETGARPMGGSFPQELIRESLGRTQLAWAVDSMVDGEAFEAHAKNPYRGTRSMCMKSLISTREGELAGIPAVALAARLASVRVGHFAALISSWRVPRTVDLLTNPAHIFLFHEDEAVLLADWSLLRELETEAQDLLFELRRESPPALSPTAAEPDDALPDDALPGGVEAALLRGLAPGARVLRCDNPAATPPRRGAESWDAAVLRLDDFGMLPVEEVFDHLTRLANCLRPGGRLLVDAPTAPASGPERVYTRTELRLLLRVAGLLPVELKGEPCAEDAHRRYALAAMPTAAA